MRQFGLIMDWIFIIGFVAAVVFVCIHTWNLKEDDDDETV